MKWLNKYKKSMSVTVENNNSTQNTTNATVEDKPFKLVFGVLTQPVANYKKPYFNFTQFVMVVYNKFLE